MLTNTYWKHNGRYQNLAIALHKMLPAEGPITDCKSQPCLEKFRMASNIYYDFHSNKLAYMKKEFKSMFAVDPASLRKVPNSTKYIPSVYSYIEASMDLIIVEAAFEVLDNVSLTETNIYEI
jgi:hypothetical protein